MKWIVNTGNVLDEAVDVLICSSNVSLNLSGGVGADLLNRYGIELQHQLHQQIAKRVPRCAYQGEVFECTVKGMPYKAVLHAVSVDPFYHSSVEVIKNLVERCLGIAASFKANRVALTALGTGYGDITLEQFAVGLNPLVHKDFPPIAEIVICLEERERTDMLKGLLSQTI